MSDFEALPVDPSSAWVDVPMLSTDALLRGGADGALNAQAIALVKRAKWLKDQASVIAAAADAALAAAGSVSGTASSAQTAAAAAQAAATNAQAAAANAVSTATNASTAASTAQASANAAQAGADASLKKAGGTMVGPLVLPGNAVSPLEAVPLQQLGAYARFGSSGLVVAGGSSNNVQFVGIPSWANEISIDLCGITQSGGQSLPELSLQLCGSDSVFGGNEMAYTVFAPDTNSAVSPWSAAWRTFGSASQSATLHRGAQITGGIRGRVQISRRGSADIHEFTSNAIMSDTGSSLQPAFCAGRWAPAILGAVYGVRVHVGANTMTAGSGIVVRWRS